MPIEKRIKMVGCHLTEPEKTFLRVHAAKQGDTTSDFIRKTLTDVLSKVEDPSNPFLKPQNKQ